MRRTKVVSGRGGRREGAGRKPTGPSPTAMRTRSVMVDDESWERWRAAAAERGVAIGELIRGSVDASIGGAEVEPPERSAVLPEADSAPSLTPISE